MSPELQALQEADFDWVRALDGVWDDEGLSPGGPHEAIVRNIVDELKGLKKAATPPGRPLIGVAGSGKTHLVSELRQKTLGEGCWFILLDVVGITDFWKSAALSFLTSLYHTRPDGRRQYEAILLGVARRFKIERAVEEAFARDDVDQSQVVELLVRALMLLNPSDALRHRDVFRALAYLRSHDIEAVGVAYAWLQGFDADPVVRAKLKFTQPPPSPVDIVKGLLWTMDLVAPTLIAVDQIDGVLASGQSASVLEEGSDFTRVLTAGLLELANVIGRGMIALTCLPISWLILQERGFTPLLQRFAAPVALELVRDEKFARALIAGRLKPSYDKHSLSPQPTTWPFTDAAVASAAKGFSPRVILMACDAHRKLCLAQGRVIPCETIAGDPPPPLPPGDYDEAVKAAAGTAAVDGLFDPKEDAALGNLLRVAIQLYAAQFSSAEDYDLVSKADPVKNIPPLHARLTFIDHRRNDHEQHFCFRALPQTNAIAFATRLKAALTAAGITAGLKKSRTLVIVRRDPPPSGAQTALLVQQFRAAGGVELAPSDEDLKTLIGLGRVAKQAEAREAQKFAAWLIARKPLCDLAFFKAAGLSPPPFPFEPEAKPIGVGESTTTRVPSQARLSGETIAPASLANAAPARDEAVPAATDAIPVGKRVPANEPVELPVALLPRHTAIIAGAGSGKTVLLRRIIEEAALAGVPAIVVDPNNDLSRLGDPWPTQPQGFTQEDAAKAARYRASVEVVVWTPGAQSGNPLFLSVLPDFAAVGEDPDERAQAVTMAADTLAPLADARTKLAIGVLNDALRAFAARGGGDLRALIAFLAELPEDASEIEQAAKLADRLANNLRAARATNALLGADGPVVDPRLLFYGPDPERTRISVLNLSGLGSDAARQDFVNRLQMTLFGWVKKNPSPRGRLYVIDEAQLFIPASAGALSKTSGVQLVAQARKYGLGIVAATQAPRGIDNKVVSNCTTQFLGKQNSPTDQQSVKLMIAASGGSADDIGRLATGEFYFKTEKVSRPFKLRTPICLSYHPPNPPTPEEVVAKARAFAATRPTPSPRDVARSPRT